MKLIGIHGHKGSGKDYLADQIIGVLGYGVKIAFADPLKDAVCSLFGYTREQLDDRDFKETVDCMHGKSPRELMQWIGTDCIRNQIGADHWVNLLDKRIGNLKNTRLVIVPDVRFQNEVDYLRKKGALLITVKGAGHNDRHMSEFPLSTCDDYVFDNSQKSPSVIANAVQDIVSML